MRADAWQYLSLASATACMAFSVFALVGTPRAYFHVLWGRYLDYLSQRLRRLHIFGQASRIANAQIVLTFVIAALTAMNALPYWYLALLLTVFGPALAIERRSRERVARIESQADAFCLALANALKSSGSIGAALETAAALMDGPIAEEMHLAVKETRLGRSLGEALEAVGPRAGSQKLATVLGAVLIGRQVGGNLPKVLEMTATTLREMERLEGVVRQKTAEGKMQLWGMALAPPAICLAIHKMDPLFFQPLTTTTIGYLSLATAMIIYAAGLIVARKVMVVDV